MVYPLIAAVVSALIEWLRIKSVHGEVLNINKIWTYTIGFILLGVCLALNYDYYSQPSFISVILYCFYFACIRGFVYDPVLNVLRGLRWDYKSVSSNSKLDIILSPVPFLALRLVYLFLAIFFYYLSKL